MAAIRDPNFWKRFSHAVHLEEAKTSPEKNESSIVSDTWLRRQQQKRRRTIVCGFVIFFTVAAVLAGIGVVLWWFSSHNWLQRAE